MNAIANTSPIPNEILDQALPYLTGEETKIMNAACRRILGYADKRDEGKARISVSLFQTLTGLARQTVIKAIKFLKSCGVLIAHGDATNEGQLWSIGRLLKLNILTDRHEEKSKRHQKKTVKARQVVYRTDQPREVNIDQKLHRCDGEVVCVTDRKWSMAQTSKRSMGQTHINKVFKKSSKQKNILPSDDGEGVKTKTKKVDNRKKYGDALFDGIRQEICEHLKFPVAHADCTASQNKVINTLRSKFLAEGFARGDAREYMRRLDDYYRNQDWGKPQYFSYTKPAMLAKYATVKAKKVQTNPDLDKNGNPRQQTEEERAEIYRQAVEEVKRLRGTA